jgi:hypothetical protein
MKHKAFYRCALAAAISCSLATFSHANSSGTPPVTGQQKIDHQSTQTPTTHSTNPENPTTCNAHKKNYSAMYESMWDKGPSIMAECGIGRLVDFDVLKIFDPIGALLDAMQGAICGWVNDATSPFITSFNDNATRANEWTADSNRGYDDWVSERQSDIYKELYAKYQSKRESGLSDIGSPYGDVVFSDESNYPPGPYEGNMTGDNSQDTGNYNTDGVIGSGGSLDSSLNDGDIIIIGGDIPRIIDNRPQQQIQNQNEDSETTSNYSEIYDIFNK